MIRSTIKLTGIKSEGRHGANPDEQDTAQPFVVDLEVEVEVGSDLLDDTADYEQLLDTVKRQVAGNSYVLIETLAYNIAADVSRLDKVAKALAIVHKPAVASALGVEDISARAVVERS